MMTFLLDGYWRIPNRKLREIEEKSAADECIQAVKKAIFEGSWAEIANPFKVIQTELCFSENILLRGSRIAVPNELVDRMLELAHEEHPGMSKMKRSSIFSFDDEPKYGGRKWINRWNRS